jgi:CheY-like chemotaxis protein
LTLLQSDTFDVVLMDMFMPGMSGPQTCHAIRHDLPAPLCDVPVIGLTASTHAQDRQLCLDAGMNAILDKPFRSPEIIAILSPYLRPAAPGPTASSASGASGA